MKSAPQMVVQMKIFQNKYFGGPPQMGVQINIYSKQNEHFGLKYIQA